MRFSFYYPKAKAIFVPQVDRFIITHSFQVHTATRLEVCSLIRDSLESLIASHLPGLFSLTQDHYFPTFVWKTLIFAYKSARPAPVSYIPLQLIFV